MRMFDLLTSGVIFAGRRGWGVVAALGLGFGVILALGGSWARWIYLFSCSFRRWRMRGRGMCRMAGRSSFRCAALY